MRNLRILVLTGVFLLAAGCSGSANEETTPAPRPTQEILIIGITAGAAPARAGVDACIETTDAHVIIEPVGSLNSLAGHHDLIISLGASPEQYIQSAQIADEQLIVTISSERRPETGISTETLALIYSGQAHFWSEVPNGGSYGSGQIGIWNYPVGHPLRRTFEAAIFGSATDSMAPALIAPNPEQLAEGVSATTGQVGYLPAAWLPEGLQTLDLPGELIEQLSLPVLISAQEKFSGGAQAFVACLQRGQGQDSLDRLYKSSS